MLAKPFNLLFIGTGQFPTAPETAAHLHFLPVKLPDLPILLLTGSSTAAIEHWSTRATPIVNVMAVVSVTILMRMQ